MMFRSVAHRFGFGYVVWKIKKTRRFLPALFVLASSCGDAGIVVPKTVMWAAYFGPLEPTYDGTVRSYADGDHQNRGNVAQLVQGWYGDPKSDGNNVYVQISFFALQDASTVSCSNGGGSQVSCSPGSSTSWTFLRGFDVPELPDGSVNQKFGARDEYYSQLAPAGVAARQVTVGCAQFGFPVPDPCASAVTSFAY